MSSLLPIRFSLAALVCALLSLPPRSAAAQPRDDGARMERIADGVYAIIHDDATDEWPHGNSGVIVGDDGVMVIDAAYLPSRAKADIALIRQVTDKPVRYLVITHWHFDHNNGIVAYRDAFPNVAVVSERESSRWIDVNNTWWPKMSTAPGSAKRLGLKALEDRLASGKDTAGRALTPEARRNIERWIGQRKNELAELASMRVVVPDLVFDGTMSLPLGRRRIELRDMGRANSPHDVTIYLPEERVLFTGDILVQSPLPYTGASWPVQWVDVLRRIEAVPIATLVPGHGPVMHDHAYTRGVRELMDATLTRTEAMIRRGMTLAQIQASLDLSDVRRTVPAWTDPSLDADWRTIVEALIERAWRGVRGQG